MELNFFEFIKNCIRLILFENIKYFGRFRLVINEKLIIEVKNLLIYGRRKSYI